MDVEVTDFSEDDHRFANRSGHSAQDAPPGTPCWQKPETKYFIVPSTGSGRDCDGIHDELSS